MSTIIPEELHEGLRIVREDGERACYVKIWKPKAKRPDYIQFRSVERREDYIQRRIESWDAWNASKAAAAAERKAFDATAVYAVGEILGCSWGYDQTQHDFYEVLTVTRQTITLQKIGSRQVESLTSMSAHVVPNAEVRGETTTHRLTSEYVKLTSYSSASKWNGKPAFTSWWR